MEEDQIEVQILEQLSLGETAQARTLCLPTQLTLEALIRARVAQTLGEADPQVLREEEQRAVDAFLANGFFVIVDEAQREDPKEVLILTPESTVRFIRLVPLVGG